MDYPKLTRRGLGLMALGLLMLWLWYPTVRDVPEPSPTPCWDLNELQDSIETKHPNLNLKPYTCSPSGRLIWQDSE